MGRGTQSNGKPKPRRTGSWAEVKTFEDPQSGMRVIISERIRGKPAYSFQIVAVDDLGPNKHIQLPCRGEVDVEHVVYSLARCAREYIAQCRERPVRAPNLAPKGTPRSSRDQE